MAQLVKANRAENIPVLSGRLVIENKMWNRISEIGIQISIQNLLRNERMIFPDMTLWHIDNDTL